MNDVNRSILWSIVLFIIAYIIYIIHAILTPFILAFFIAYLLNPIVSKIARFGLSRTIATLFIISLFFVFIVTIFILLLPLIYKQFIMLIDVLPIYANNLYHKILHIVNIKLQHLDEHTISNIQQKITESSDQLFISTTKITKEILSSIFSSTVNIVNIISMLLLTPIISFYMLQDWENMISKIYDMLPKKHAKVIKEQLHAINLVLSGYIRGQLNICLLLGTIYAISLSLVGLQFGLAIGFITGIFSFIPYAGILFGFITSIIIAYFQFDAEIIKLITVASIFIVAQIIEGNFITPRIIGSKIGLHPAWIIFGLLTGATLLGFTGILLSIPLTAITGVVVKFIIKQYKSSKLYLLE